ncbi:hypothetical protein TIFTF001_008363 [Ficus carica]|uniref:Uncharacterized protein n=1 Tax=Ficus carica TaxID=3494 RepID=A0AA88D1N5_FICCA|nr:hypothetical protein TIFTF001_008363 [Ficus carica]
MPGSLYAICYAHQQIGGIAGRRARSQACHDDPIIGVYVLMVKHSLKSCNMLLDYLLSYTSFRQASLVHAGLKILAILPRCFHHTALHLVCEVTSRCGKSWR